MNDTNEGLGMTANDQTWAILTYNPHGKGDAILVLANGVLVPLCWKASSS